VGIVELSAFRPMRSGGKPIPGHFGNEGRSQALGKRSRKGCLSGRLAARYADDEAGASSRAHARHPIIARIR
ncbi:MAG: hypothetical protein RL756_2927, partial [Pseudomonadota bacterium]